LQTPTSGLALGFVQANLVIIPAQMAFEFLLFCFRNPKACPLLDVTEAGDPEPKLIAPARIFARIYRSIAFFETALSLLSQPTLRRIGATIW